MAAVSAINLIIQKGTYFQETFNLIGEDDGIINLSGATVTAKLRKHPTAGIAYTFTTTLTIAQGTVDLSMDSNVTSTLPSGRCYYDILLTTSGGLISKVVEGNVIVEETASL